MAPSGDPVGTGLITSLARPGGNVTGLSAATAEVAGKSLELLKELVPGAIRVGVLFDPSNVFTKPFLEQVHLAASSLGLDVRQVAIHGPDSLATSLANARREQIDAAIVQPTLPLAAIAKLMQENDIPAVSGNRAFADAGGLMSYSASVADRYRNAANYVDRILKGARPADLPVQLPTRFELVINLRSAKRLNLEPKPVLLNKADELIE